VKAAHQGKCERRNADFSEIVSGVRLGQWKVDMLHQFHHVFWMVCAAAPFLCCRSLDTDLLAPALFAFVVGRSELPVVHTCLFCLFVFVPCLICPLCVECSLDFGSQGDDHSPTPQLFEEITAKIKDKKFAELFAHDQLVRERKANRAFVGFSEGNYDFPPTFKVIKGKVDEYNVPPHLSPFSSLFCRFLFFCFSHLSCFFVCCFLFFVFFAHS
jgi:hypothetical protein